MKFHKLFHVAAGLAAAGILLAGCGPAPSPATPTNTATPDPCTPANIRTAAQQVQKLMREFEDATALASNTPRAQVGSLIADQQRIRRDAEDLDVPTCLAQLKSYELNHMNLVINTMLGFLGGADQKTTDQGIALARQQHDAYMLELAHILGLTVVVAPTSTGATATAASATTPAEKQTPAGAGLTITVQGPSTVNLRKTPSLDGETVGRMDVGASATVLARNPDGSWLLVQVPGQGSASAWVYAPLVTASGPTDRLPVATAIP